MAIVKMNKFTLLTFESKKEELLRRLQGFSNVEFINLQDENLLEANEELQSLNKDEVDSRIAKYEEDLSKAKTTLDFLTHYIPKKSGHYFFCFVFFDPAPQYFAQEPAEGQPMHLTPFFLDLTI